jgi:hypothetical protein
VILQSTSVCPSCKKHVRFGSGTGGDAVVPTFSPLRIEGAIRHPKVGEAWEYVVVVTITNDKGEEVTRQVVGVGAIPSGEERKFAFSVEVFKPDQQQEKEKGGDTATTLVKPLPPVPAMSSLSNLKTLQPGKISPVGPNVSTVSPPKASEAPVKPAPAAPATSTGSTSKAGETSGKQASAAPALSSSTTGKGDNSSSRGDR